MTTSDPVRRAENAPLHVFTSASVNYLPKVRLLCESVRRFHPEAIIHLALADERPPWLATAGEPFDDILELAQLDIPNWRRWAFTHSIVELSTAIKPFALGHLMRRPGCETVLYFDPDMVLFSRVDDILSMLEHGNLALTPHQNKPEQTLEAILDNEVASLKHGVFNLGFIGVRNGDEGRRFAAWWGERTYHLCRADVSNGLFTDQKWLDFAPIFFEGVAIIKSSRHNVATWNLTTRRLTGSFDAGFTVDGEPLGFYHFTGFDSGAHRIMALKNAAASDAAHALIAWYARKIEIAAGDPISAWPWAFGTFSDGSAIGAGHRWLYRERTDLQTAFPDPFDARPDRPTFRAWCESEGKLRYPDLLSRNARASALRAMSLRTRIPLGAAFRLLLLMMTPKAGRALRGRAFGIWRSEGIGGFARRLHMTRR
jgi:hypothetical protein